jgi:alginate O-acetyltransferase complex protein AlgJ
MVQEPAAADDGKVVRGKDGWLFVANDTNRVLDQHVGILRFSGAELEAWRVLLEQRRGRLAQLGIGYAFFVAPNPHSVYPEKLPEGIRCAGPRPVQQLIGHLREKRSPVEVHYPLERLLGEKDRLIYAKTDSHWTELGAFIAYQELLRALPFHDELRELGEDDLFLDEGVVPGDLGHKVDPPAGSAQAYVEVRDPRARFVSDNRVRTNGRRIEYECPAGSRTCLIFGDSFCVRLLPFLAESFRRLVFAHITTLDTGLIRRERPDVVLNVMNERFLVRVPRDEGAPALDDLEAAKRAEGDTYPPRAAHAGNRVDSPL